MKNLSIRNYGTGTFTFQFRCPRTNSPQWIDIKPLETKLIDTADSQTIEAIINQAPYLLERNPNAAEFIITNVTEAPKDVTEDVVIDALEVSAKDVKKKSKEALAKSEDALEQIGIGVAISENATK